MGEDSPGFFTTLLLSYALGVFISYIAFAYTSVRDVIAKRRKHEEETTQEYRARLYEECKQVIDGRSEAIFVASILWFVCWPLLALYIGVVFLKKTLLRAIVWLSTR